ncbi:MAG: PD-(D/E)XK nuclease domain-containing protein, partial [Firmicutes bacterium]|nr:PD-(D/E)XK nuclease domain-containing protein [Bacillota bacterium]
VLQVDPERERISLGLKQISEDPFADYVSAHRKGAIVSGKVVAVDARGVTLELADGITGYIKAADLSPLRKALEEGDCDRISDFLSEKLMATISYYDYDETYYHGFLTGLLTGMGGYEVLSNRESGAGRPDILLKTPRIRNGRAMILELKVSDTFAAMEERCAEALQQAKNRNYAAALRNEGYENISCYGLCFYKKECLAAKAE